MARKHPWENIAALQKGECEAILSSREGALDALAHLASELGVLEAVTEIKLSRLALGKTYLQFWYR